MALQVNALKECKYHYKNVFIFSFGIFFIYSNLFFLSKFSTTKITGGNRNFKYSGCTTDSGGGGTGNSLHECMENQGLCQPRDTYLIGFCTLHTLQLTLGNGLHETIGKGGLGRRNAMQLLHSVYDLQEVMEFGIWKMEWKKAHKKCFGHDSLKDVPKIPAPIITRWWTVGQAAAFLVENLSLIRSLCDSVKSWKGTGTFLSAATKIASSVLSLSKEMVIMSDVKLITCFHQIFLNPNFSWMQKGDEKIGNTPGFLGRFMLSRYFLMYECLNSLQNDGWKEVSGMKLFSDELKEDHFSAMDNDPRDPKKERKIQLREWQNIKANKFFKIAFLSLKKHYEKYCDEMLFLSLYDEPHVTRIVAKVLKEDCMAVLDVPDDETTIFSAAHGVDVNISKLYKFLKERVDVEKQMEIEHIKKCEDLFPLLLGE